MYTERRDILKTIAGLTAGLALPGLGGAPDQALGSFPMRKLGRTGEAVTMLGLGGYHIGWTSEEKARAVIEDALASGVTFFDTAEAYGKGRSEERYGRYLTPDHRDSIYLMTKTSARTAAGARKHLEESLQRLKTDVLDLWQIHSIRSPEDVDQRLENGVLDVLLEAKASGQVRHIGFTGHADPRAHLQMLRRTAADNPFDTCLLPINPLDAAAEQSFTRDVLPILVERGIAPLAMKTLADGRFFAAKNQHHWRTDDPVVPGRMQVKDAIHFAWSLPISVLITGAENVDFLKEKVRLGLEFKDVPKDKREELINRVADLAEQGKVEYYKRG